MHAGDADTLGSIRGGYINVSMFGKRFVVLGNLVALGQIGIEVVLSGKDRGLADCAVQRRSGPHGVLDRLPIENGQRSGKAKTYRANVRVRRRAKSRRAAAKCLSHGEKLDMNF